MKQGRQGIILEVIDKYDVETQDELSAILKEKGYEVTQATISRDIKELKLVKVQSANGTYKYAASGKEQMGKLDVFKRVFRDTVISVEPAASLVVVRTMTGSANAAAEAIDELELDDVAGTIAGDNTIFVAVREEGMQKRVIDELSKMSSSKR
ncbi:MAG: arginine repressor [Eubacteriales bacterium]|nr:arginine repressor [Eubacteriales bacterium]